MPREKRPASPSSDDDDGWSDVLVGPDMDLLLQAGELVDLTYNLAGVEAGVDAAARLVQHLMPPARFRQLVEAWRGREGPGRGCSGKELSRWKHLSSIAVDAVARAALQGKVGELEAKIQRRQALKAAAAEAEAKLAAALAAMQEGQEEEALQSPSEDTAGGAAAAAAEAAGAAEVSGLSPGFGAAAAGMVELSARKQGAAAAGAGVRFASTARQDAPGGAAAARGAAVPVGSGGTLQHTQQVSKQQTLSGLFRKADMSHQAGQQTETGAVPLAPPAIVGKWTGPRTNGNAADCIPASDQSQFIDDDYGLLWESEAAAAAVKAAMEEDAAQEQLSAELRSQGCPVLPEEGRMAFANKHLIFKTRMQVTCFMSPSYVDDKAAGAKKHMDNLLFTYLDDQQAILLAYENLDVQLNTAFLHPEPPPLLTVKAAADVTTFEPTPGDIICGVVSKLSHNAITLTVLGCISAAIERQHIPPDWEYDHSAHCWVPGGDYTRCVLRGDRLACMIMTHPKQDPDEEEVLFNLEGTLLVPHTGLCTWQWPKQQRLRGLLAALNSQGEYDEQRDKELQAQQQELMQELQQEGLACKVLLPFDADPQQLQQLMMTGQQLQLQQQQQQQQRRHHSGSKDERHAAKEAAKAAAKAEKQWLKEAAKAERRTAKAAEKAARKEARKAEKAAAKAAEKAAKAAAKAEKRAREQQQSPPAAEQPPAKKHRQHHSSEQPQDATAAAAAAPAGNPQEGTQQQPGSTHSKEKHKKHKEHKSSHKDDKKKKDKKDKKKDKST